MSNRVVRFLVVFCTMIVLTVLCGGSCVGAIYMLSLTSAAVQRVVGITVSILLALSFFGAVAWLITSEDSWISMRSED